MQSEISFVIYCLGPIVKKSMVCFVQIGVLEFSVRPSSSLFPSLGDSNSIAQILNGVFTYIYLQKPRKCSVTHLGKYTKIYHLPTFTSNGGFIYLHLNPKLPK